MSTQETRATGPRSGWDVAAFVVLGLLLGCVTIFASFFGSLLGFEGVGNSNSSDPAPSTLSSVQAGAIMLLAVGGPWVIAVVVLLWGVVRLVSGKVSWPFPLAGFVLLFFNFFVCGGLIAFMNR